MSQTNEIVFERVEFLCDKSLFKGKVYRPLNLEECKGVVIFSHGLGYCDRQYDIRGEDFARQKYLLLTYNLRGHAATPGKWTLQNSVEDLIEGINFLSQKYVFPNNERVCVIGHSTGALIALLASLKDRRIRFASAVTTVTSLTDSYLHWFDSGFNIEVKEYFKTKGIIPAIIEKFLDDKTMLEKYRLGDIPREELEVPHRYGLLKSDSFNGFFYEIAYSPNLVSEAGKFDIPVLLFRGEYDEIMDVKKTHLFYESLNKKRPSKLYITDSKNHFHNDRWGMIQAETLKFFDEFCEIKSDIENTSRDVLIIDDEKIITQTLQRLIHKKFGVNVSVANSGKEALEKIGDLSRVSRKQFDLIICDIRMPELDGIETIRRAKSIFLESKIDPSPVVFMTGYEGAKAQEEAKAVGYVDYLRKPFDTEEFLFSLRKYLK